MWRAPFGLPLLVLLLVLGCVTPPLAITKTEAPHTLPEAGPGPPVSRPAGWYPIYRVDGAASSLRVDDGRGRLLVAARYWGLTSNGTSWETDNLLVLDRSGNLLHNVSLSSSSAAVMDFDVDRSTGDAYVSLSNGTILRVNPASGQIVNSWTYWSGLSTIVAQSGELFVAPCCQTGSVMRLSGQTGALLRNYTVAGQGNAVSIAVDPAGRWFFVVLSAPVVGDLYRVNVTTGQTTGFGPANFAQLSADGRRVWLCGWGNLQWYWLGNDTAGYSGVSCPNLPVDSPATGVLAMTYSERFFVESGDVGTFHVQVRGEPAQAIALGWTAGGSALVAIAWTLSGHYEVGLWDGGPWLDAPNGQLLNPNRDPICYPLVTVGGVNASSIVEYQDGVELGRGSPRMTQACFGRDANASVALGDGPHIGRIVGYDRVGRRLDAAVSFETDGTPPVVAITSPTLTTTSPYALSGTVDDPHLLRVNAGTTPALVSGRTWSATLDLRIGNNTIGVIAEDTVGNIGTAIPVIRYWPAFDHNIIDEPHHFQVSIPPGWTGFSSLTEAGVTFDAMVLAPPDGTYPYNTSATVRSESHPGINETQAVAYARAIEGLKQVSLFSVDRPYFVGNTTVDGHPAARIRAAVGSRIIGTGSLRADLIQTYVVSGNYSRVYVISFNVSWMQPQYETAGDWIVQSFHIRATPPTEPTSILLLGALAGGGVAVVGVAMILLWIRRSSDMSRLPPGGPPPGT